MRPTAELSFYDFKVGEKLETCFELAEQDPEVSNLMLEEKEDFTFASFIVTIPNFEHPDKPERNIELEGRANAYKGSIFNISLIAKSWGARDAIPAMYKSKYGQKKTRRGTTKWSFSNGSIVVGERVHQERQKRLIPNAEKLNLRFYDSYFEEVDVEVFDWVYVDYDGENAKSLRKKLRGIYDKERREKYREMEEERARQEAEREAQKRAIEEQLEEAKKKGVSTVRF